MDRSKIMREKGVEDICRNYRKVVPISWDGEGCGKRRGQELDSARPSAPNGAVERQ